MATLHVRNVPEALYEQLRRQAEQQGRSLSAEVIMLLEQVLVRTGRDQTASLGDIHRRRSFNPSVAGAPNRVTLIHDDRGGYEAPPEESETGIAEALLTEALSLGQHRTIDEVVAAALAEYVMRQRQREIIDLMGTIEYDEDYDYKAQRARL